MAIDWRELDALDCLAAAEIERFAAGHQGETFNGFMFDCNSEYGQVLLCLNTPESLRQSAQESAARYSTAVAEKEEKLRWCLILRLLEPAENLALLRRLTLTLRSAKKFCRPTVSWRSGDAKA